MRTVISKRVIGLFLVLLTLQLFSLIGLYFNPPPFRPVTGAHVPAFGLEVVVTHPLGWLTLIQWIVGGAFLSALIIMSLLEVVMPPKGSDGQGKS